MKSFFKQKSVLIIGLLIVLAAGYLFLMPSRTVDFSADVKPILNNKCISCHGGVKAKAGFSVLFRDEALAKTESGKPAIIPGDPGASEMIRRITANDPEERMPYKHEPLSKDEIKILTQWIKQGAKWGDHWAYLPVKETELPDVDDPWIRNDVDKFIYEKLKELELKPSVQADKPSLLRRVSLDLIGMYPSEAVAKQFLQSTDEKGYEVLVDSLLASPRFGERWASLWLDLSRYADTKGYESDEGRTIWKYRDWLINAFNEDKPYNEFLVEQLAGDLLPDPTDAQYIATAFHRNTMNNMEGGTDNEEFRTAAVIDRVNTTWESLMSTTFSCVQCHSHPYDPIKHAEYYKFLAYFNNTRDEDVPAEYPLLREYNDTLKQTLNEVVNWVQQYASKEEANRVKLFLRTWQPSVNSTTADSLKNAVIGNNNYALMMQNYSSARLKRIDLQHSNQLIFNFISRIKGGVLKFRTDSPEGNVFASVPLQKMNTFQKFFLSYTPQQGIHDVYVTYENATLPANSKEFALIFDWFAFVNELPGKNEPGYAAINQDYRTLLDANPVTTPVMVENPSWMWRASNVFERGAWTSKGEEVQPDVPQTFAFAMPANAPKNRLGLAMWLTDKKNPLVSRTLVNRFWEQLFGTGIAETLEDMGTQGATPTHQELLDHLSWKLMNQHKWSMKALLKELVMSAAYMQDSKLTEEIKQKDLFNRYYARGPRVRLSAEQLRDQHLCISGAMSAKMYGPGVMPWQPEGIWLSPYNGAKWKSSEGEDQYRRAVYTYWKRTAPYPSMIAFDGIAKVVCNARRIRTNTPLQALVTLNDSAYLDMSRHFAYRMQKEAGRNPEQQIAKGYEMMLYKKIDAAKLKTFTSLYQTAFNEFKTDQIKTRELIGKDDEHNNAETAALVIVANAMLNIDEVIMKN